MSPQVRPHFHSAMLFTFLERNELNHTCPLFKVQPGEAYF